MAARFWISLLVESWHAIFFELCVQPTVKPVPNCCVAARVLVCVYVGVSVLLYGCTYARPLPLHGKQCCLNNPCNCR